MEEQKYTRTIRILKLMDILTKKTPSGGVTLEELVNACNVTPRQIYRDIAAIEELLGVQVIRPQKGKHSSGCYKLDQYFNINIGPETAAALFLSVLRQKGTPLAGKINDIKDTLIAALFKNRFTSSKKDLENLHKRIFIIEEELLNTNKAGEIINKLIQAIIENKVISITYYKPSKKEESTRDISPYGLVCKHNTWYLVGFCHKNIAIRTFRLDLIHSVFILSKKFAYPENFCFESYFGDSWGVFTGEEKHDILIKVNPEIAYRFKNFKYHPSQKIIREYKNGSILVSYTASGLYELTAWLLQWGELVEIIKPESLRKQMKEKLQKIIKKYE